MKKTLIINIGNTIIHIAEDAYEMLTNYLNEIKSHFSQKADDFEIVTDIENRIAEMLGEMLAEQNKQVVEIADVQTVVAQMGRVQDFEEEEDAAQNPSSNQFTTFAGDKKLFRDTDEGLLAGVCAGLGHYFGVEYRWIRLIAFLTIFLGGTGIIVYIILWIAIPPAVTRAQRMGMKGEATNLFGYQRSFEEDLLAFKENLRKEKSPNVIKSIFKGIGSLIKGAFSIFFKIIAVAIIIMGIGAIVALTGTIAGLWGFWDENPFHSFPFSIVEEGYRGWVVFFSFVTIFIPLLALVLFSIRVAFNKKSLNKTASFALLFIWLVGVAGVGYYTTKILSEFQEHASLVKNVEIKPYKKLYINADQSMGFSADDSLHLRLADKDLDGRVIVEDYDEHPFRMPKRIHFNIEKSATDKMSMVQTFEAQGKTFENALENAQNIRYQYYQKDSMLVLSPRLQFRKDTKWRNQELTITLQVPVGTRLMLNNNVYHHIYTNLYGCDNRDHQDDAYNEWVMTEDGIKCVADIRAKSEEKIELIKDIARLEKLVADTSLSNTQEFQERKDSLNQKSDRLKEIIEEQKRY